MKNIYFFWIDTFWKNPARLYALKVTISIALGIFPAIITNNAYLGATFALGVVAMALSETQVHPKARIKSSLFTIVCFMITAALVELLTPSIILFGVFLVVTSFILLLLGGINSHYQRVTFGILLINVYTMLGINANYAWYIQSIYFAIGGMVYNLLSIGLLYYRPWRVIKELMAVGYYKLSEYAITKSTLFPSSSEKQEEIRNRLAQINIDLSSQINILKFELDSFYQESSPKSIQRVKRYYHKWDVLQELHTRFASSHERYDLLSRKTKNLELIEGFGQLMYELGNGIKSYSQTLLTGRVYQHPISLKWTASALKQLLEKYNSDSQYTALSLLLKNLLEVERLLKSFENDDVNLIVERDIIREPKSVPFRTLLNFKNSRFRFSVRLTLCYLIGYIIIILADISKGGWLLMTCLIISQQTYSATNERLIHRMLGTLSGVVLGVFLNEILPTHEGQLLLLLGSIFAFFYWLQSNYTIAVIFITTFVMAIFNIQTGTGLSVMTPRIIDTVIAAILVFLATRFLWPDWQYKRLPNLLKTSLNNNILYFESLSHPEKRSQAQRKAHQADNELAMAWKNMLSEPKGKRWFLQNAYNLSYLNHSLLSYISAFDTQQFYLDLTLQEKQFCQEITTLLKETLHLTEKVAHQEVITKIDYYQKWENQLFDLKKKTHNPKILLIHNIGHVALELLMETNELICKR